MFRDISYPFIQDEVLSVQEPLKLVVVIRGTNMDDTDQPKRGQVGLGRSELTGAGLKDDGPIGSV